MSGDGEADSNQDNNDETANGDITFQVDNANMEEIEVQAGEGFAVEKNTAPDEGIIVHQKEYLK